MPSRRTRILVADGDIASRAGFVWRLVCEGFWVEPTSNGFDAGVALENPQPPDVAIIDLSLPHFSGRRLIEGMRGSDRLGAVPIIATGTMEPFAPLPPGVAFLKKPIDSDLLLELIREVVRDDLTSFFPDVRAPANRPRRRDS